MQFIFTFLSFAHYLTLFDKCGARVVYFCKHHNSGFLGSFLKAVEWSWRFCVVGSGWRDKTFFWFLNLCSLYWVPIQNGGSVKQQPLAPAVEVAPAFSCCEHFWNQAHHAPSEILAAACPSPFFSVRTGAPPPSSQVLVYQLLPQGSLSNYSIL